MKAHELKRKLAQEAYDKAENKNASEKYIRVSEDVFNKCIADDNPSHQKTHTKRGFIRTYLDSFFVPNKGGLGQDYCHGVVYIINKDAEINQSYEIDIEDTKTIQHNIKVLSHRVVELKGDKFIMSKQRYNFD